MKKKPNPSAAHIPGNPQTARGMALKYGTYNIQPTADADSSYPAIAQGLPKRRKK